MTVTAVKGIEYCSHWYDQHHTSLTALPLPTFLPLKYFPRLSMPTCINSRPPDLHRWLAGKTHTAYIQISIRGKPSLDMCLTSSKQAACMTSELDVVLLEARLGPPAQYKPPATQQAQCYTIYRSFFSMPSQRAGRLVNVATWPQLLQRSNSACILTECDVCSS